MTVEEIRELINLATETGIDELEVQRGDNRVRIRRAVAGHQDLVLAQTVAPPVAPPRAETAAAKVKIPEHVDFHTAAAAMLQGMTAHYLTHSTFPLKSGDTCLVHAAAGGAGGLIVQMAKNIGARVLGTVSTAEKAEIARHAGADEIILYTEQEFDVEARRLTGGRGARS